MKLPFCLLIAIPFLVCGSGLVQGLTKKEILSARQEALEAAPQERLPGMVWTAAGISSNWDAKVQIERIVIAGNKYLLARTYGGGVSLIPETPPQ